MRSAGLDLFGMLAVNLLRLCWEMTVKVDGFRSKAGICRLFTGSIFLFVLAAPCLADSPPSRTIDASIEQLGHKLFRMQTVSGNLSMTVIKGLPDDAARFNLSTKGYGKDCSDNYASLNRSAAAAMLPGAHAIVALLECPSANDGDASSILALFDEANTDVPVCFKRLDLMSKEGYLYMGSVKSVEVRRHPDGGHIVIPVLAGGDAGDSWESFVFLHMDNQCQTTVLSSFYAGIYADDEQANACQGEEIKYTFINPTTISVRRSVIACTAAGQKVTSRKTLKLDTRALLKDPKQRVVEP